MRSALDVVKLFLCWANRDGDLLTNLKIQKLLYYAQAWHLANFGKPLFDDSIEAWDLGPVVPSVYNKLKKFKSAPVIYKSSGNCMEENQFTKQELTYLREFYSKFVNYSANVLVNASHNEMPWKDAYARGRAEISISSMKSYYSNRIKK